MDVNTRIIKLRKMLNEHNIQYYVYDNPTISDYEYDLLLTAYERLKSRHEVLIISLSG